MPVLPWDADDATIDALAQAQERAAKLDGLIESLLLDAELTPGRLAVHVITRDPSDNMFLTCAVEGRADYIVSGDQDLLTVQSYQGIPIVTAAEFLRILAQTR